MDKEDVVTDVLTKLFFCSSDVPDPKLLCFSLAQDERRCHGSRDLCGSRAEQ